jgi:hypothetical protein
MYKIQMQFIAGYDNIWVSQINPEDTIWEFDNEAEAISKSEELQASDPSGRLYRVDYPLTEENTTEQL